VQANHIPINKHRKNPPAINAPGNCEATAEYWVGGTLKAARFLPRARWGGARSKFSGHQILDIGLRRGTATKTASMETLPEPWLARFPVY
jgi:hypothetical protein